MAKYVAIKHLTENKKDFSNFKDTVKKHYVWTKHVYINRQYLQGRC